MNALYMTSHKPTSVRNRHWYIRTAGEPHSRMAISRSAKQTEEKFLEDLVVYEVYNVLHALALEYSSLISSNLIGE